MATNTAPQTNSCAFLKLPAELRNTVYELALKQFQTPEHQAALVQTCRQIYAEAMPILYSTNTFAIFNGRSVDQLSRAVARLQRTKAVNLGLVGSVHLYPASDLNAIDYRGKGEWRFSFDDGVKYRDVYKGLSKITSGTVMYTTQLFGFEKLIVR